MERPLEYSKQIVFGVKIAVTYTNYKGVTNDRIIIPDTIWYGSTQWHPEPQWLLRAFDTSKGQMRDFALKDLKL